MFCVAPAPNDCSVIQFVKDVSLLFSRGGITKSICKKNKDILSTISDYIGIASQILEGFALPISFVDG